MKTTILALALATCAALFAGCGASIEVTPERDPHRTVSGTIEFRADIALPDDAVLVVRVIDPAGISQVENLAKRDLPIGDRAKVEPVPEILAEQTITAPKGASIPFRIEFTADDDLMRHGLNIDARISYGGKVHFRTASAHALTLGNLEYPHQVWLEAALR